jgi:GNAT superfamily N-acetyltransferase
MEIKEFRDKKEMLRHFDILTEVYPNLTMEEYSAELDVMIPNNYHQVAVYEGDTCIGLTGVWIGSKLWCGKYMELDNVVVSSSHRKKGVGDFLFSYMERQAKEIGCTMVALDSYSDNFDAHKFFYKKNFVPRGFHFINVLDRSKVR